MSDNLKIRMPEWARNMYNRLLAKIDAGGGGGGEENVIESISMNGVNVPPDANKNVALAESDPTVPIWAKQSSKPTYTASEVGAIPTTQKGAAGGVAELDSSGKVPSSQLPPVGEENVIEAISFNGANVPPDANKRVSMTETDPTVPSWAKAATKPSYTAQEVGALPDNTPIPTKTSDLANDSGFLTNQTGVTGVKGDAENAYRQGNVNLTPANIGAQTDVGLYIDAQGYLCQRIGRDT